MNQYQKKHLPIYTYHDHQSSLSASFIYYDPWHPPCSIYNWHPPLHTPYISSPNHYLFFSAHAYTIATCFAVVPKLSSNRSLSLNPLLGTQSCSLMPHIHLTILISAHRSATSFSFLWARSHFYAAYYFYFAHNCCTISLSLSMIYPYW